MPLVRIVSCRGIVLYAIKEKSKWGERDSSRELGVLTLSRNYILINTSNYFESQVERRAAFYDQSKNGVSLVIEIRSEAKVRIIKQVSLKDRSKIGWIAARMERWSVQPIPFDRLMT